MSQNQFQLLGKKKFLPFFITQSLGAFNDNVFKQALIIMISYETINLLTFNNQVLANIANVLFILPFLLFSAIAGQICEKYEKSQLIQKIKFVEILIMLCACVGFYFSNIYILLTVLFFMGFQSSIFGPIKYGYIPQHLEKEELIGGNALIETSTFLSILLGIILAGVLLLTGKAGVVYLCLVITFVSLIGFLLSKKIPYTPAVVPDLKINWNFLSETYQNFKFSKQNKSVFLCMLGISWFWGYGAVYVTQIPNYAEETLAGDESVATLCYVLFCFGIGLGSLITEKLSAGKIEMGLVPIGAFGLSLFSYELYSANTASGLSAVYNYMEFLKLEGTWKILLNMVMIGVSGGLFTVPLYAQIQHKGDKQHISRIIAGLNIINALFVLLSGIFSIAVLMNFTIPELFFIVALMNIAISIFIFIQVPEFIFRLVTWLLVNTIYRIRTKNMKAIPKHGACVLVCNHISYVDALIIGGYCKRNVRFVMHHTIFKAPVMGKLFKMAKAIPIAPAHENEELMQAAFDEIARKLEKDEVVCIFPEGRLTTDGNINEFKKGIEKIIERNPVPVIPMALKGLWGSWFSRFHGRAMKGFPRKFMAKIELEAGECVPPEKVTAEYLFEKVSELRGDRA